MGSLGGSSSKTKPLSPAQLQGYYNNLNTNSGGRLADFALRGTQPTAYQGLGDAGRVSAPQATTAALGYQSADIAGQLQAPTLGPAAQVNYSALTPDQVTAAGGLGALREQVARRQNAQTLAQFAADPSLTTFQRLRANQLENQDFGGTLDALAAEREAAITGLLSDQAQRTLQAALADQSAANQTSQFNATQQAAAQQFNIGTALTEAQRQYAAQAANAGLTRDDMETLARIYFGGAGSTQSQSSGLFGNISLAV